MDFLQNPKKLIQCFRKPHFPVAFIRKWPEIDALHGQSQGRFLVVDIHGMKCPLLQDSMQNLVKAMIAERKGSQVIHLYIYIIYIEREMDG